MALQNWFGRVGKNRFVWNQNRLILPVLVEVVVRPTHDQQPWQDMDEDPSDPGGHGVGLRGPKVNVEHDDSYTYAGTKQNISNSVDIKSH